jgi:hypothetical protein
MDEVSKASEMEVFIYSGRRDVKRGQLRYVKGAHGSHVTERSRSTWDEEDAFVNYTTRARVSAALDGDSSHHPTQKLSYFPSLILGHNKMSLFDGVTFFCTSTLSDKRKAELNLLLEHNGARPVLLGEATHLITLSPDYEGQDGAKEGSVTVTVRLS